MTTDAPEKPSTAAEKAHADLQAALRRLRTEEGWQAWLVSKSRLYRHSTMNQLLIWSQFPEATICRGRRQWGEDFNRSLKTGATTIWIRAPRTKKTGEIDPKTGEEKRKVYFKNVRVYDVSETYAIPGLPVLPVEPPRDPIEGESHRRFILRYVRWAKDELGITTTFRDIPGTGKGWYDHENKQIVVDSTMSANEHVRTLVHELCHACGYQDYEDGRGRVEACTEAAAFIACSMINLDVSGESVPYIAGWSEDAEEVIEGDIKKIDEIARRVAAAGEEPKPPPAA